jgi:hypothetical protein
MCETGTHQAVELLLAAETSHATIVPGDGYRLGVSRPVRPRTGMPLVVDAAFV